MCIKCSDLFKRSTVTHRTSISRWEMGIWVTKPHVMQCHFTLVVSKVVIVLLVSGAQSWPAERQYIWVQCQEHLSSAHATSKIATNHIISLLARCTVNLECWASWRMSSRYPGCAGKFRTYNCPLFTYNPSVSMTNPKYVPYVNHCSSNSSSACLIWSIIEGLIVSMAITAFNCAHPHTWSPSIQV